MPASTDLDGSDSSVSSPFGPPWNRARPASSARFPYHAKRILKFTGQVLAPAQRIPFLLHQEGSPRAFQFLAVLARNLLGPPPRVSLDCRPILDNGRQGHSRDNQYRQQDQTRLPEKSRLSR